LSSFGRIAGKARSTNLACRRARDRQGQVAFAMACGHPLTVTARGGQSKLGRNEEMVAIEDQA
jgi:hypothetical protein